MNIGLFFGSFNPVHNGHLALAKQLLKAAKFDRIWFVLTPQNPLKEECGLLNDETRLQLLKLALEHDPLMDVCTIEFKLPAPHYTIHTLKELTKIYPDNRFALIIGADNLAIFHNWKDYQTILKEYPIIVYPRKGTELSALKKEYPQVRVIDAPLYPVSSTEIRELIKEGKDASDFLPASVTDFIVKNKLYQ
jgi:nicotinate-nucleotide adenylyltransferase